MTHVANVTIDNTQVAADLTDYPVYVDLSLLPASFWSTVASGGGDIRCYKSDGTTELAREVVSCDTTAETGELHLLYSGTLSSSVDTVIQIHADGTSSDYAVGATYGRNAVWSDYAAVYHGDGDPSSTLTDSTGNYDATTTGMSSADEVSGQIGSGFNISSTKYAKATASVPNSYPFVLQAWSYRTNAANSARAIAVGDKDSQIKFAHITAIADTDLRAFHHNYGETATNFSDSPIQDTTNEWVKSSGVFDSDSVIASRNGVFSTASTNNTNPISDTDEIWIGGLFDPSPVNSDSAVIDELRIRLKTITEDWDATEYANQSDPGTFYAATDPSAGGGTNYDVSVTFGSEGGVTMTGLVGFGADFTVDMSAGIDSSALADASADFTAAAQAGAVIESRADFLVSITTGAEAGQAMTGAVTAGGTVLASLLVSAEMGATATAEAQALASMLTSAQAGQVMSGSVDGVTNIEAAMLAGYDAGASAEAQADALAALLVSYGAGLSAFEDSSIPASMVLSAAADMGMTATIGAEVSFITAAETDAVFSGQVDASAVIEVSTEAAATMIASAASSAGIEVASIANIEIFASSFSGDIVTPEHRIYRVSFELRTFSVEPRVSTFTVQ
jgi:hypothetical protein